MATAGPFCRRNAWTERYLRWRSLVQPWESCITRPGNINAGDDDSLNHLRCRCNWNTPDQNCFCLDGIFCSRIDVGRPSGKPSTGATTPRLGLCSELCFHARHARDAVHSYPAAHQVEGMGPRRAWPRGFSYITIAGPARASRNC